MHIGLITNGVVSGAIDYMKSLHTLDTVVVCKSKKANGTYPKNYRISRSKMEATLHTIHYKQVIRDAVFRNANDGMYVAYFETASVAPDYRTALTLSISLMIFARASYRAFLRKSKRVGWTMIMDGSQGHGYVWITIKLL